MAGQLIRLKLRMMWNTMRSQTVVMVLSILGFLYYLAMSGMAFVGVAFGARSDYSAEVGLGISLIGPLIVAGWVLVPILYSGMDNTLDPRRLSPYVEPSAKLGRALIAASCVGAAGILSFLLLLLPAWFYVWEGSFLTALCAAVGAVLSLLIGAVWARSMTTWVAVRLESSRRKDLMTVLGTIFFLALVTPMGVWIKTLSDNLTVENIQLMTDYALWSPFGAPMGIAVAFAQGAYVAALARGAITILTLLGGWLLWMRVLTPAMAGSASPISHEAEQALAEKRRWVDPTQEEEVEQRRRQEGRAQGLPRVEAWQRLGLSTPTASLAARTMRYWIHDPRLSTQLAMFILFPVIAVLFSRSEVFESANFGVFFLFMIPVLSGTVIGSLMQYDSTGAWITIASGMTGRQERAGRLWGSLFQFPLLAVGIVFYGVILGSDAQTILFQTTLALSLFAASAATSLILGARWVYPVQPPGTSPMATKGTGNFTLTMLIQLAGAAGSGVCGSPAIAALVVAYMGFFPLWIASVIACLWSVLLLWVSVVIGGRLWDRYAVDCLTAIRSWPGH